jgi:general secretion pathway protein L
MADSPQRKQTGSAESLGAEQLYMALLSNDSRLFGLHIGSIAGDASAAWRSLCNSPAVSWLNPQPFVRLVQTDGTSAVWQGGDCPRPLPQVSVNKARFWGLELPQDLVLLRELSLPLLPPDQIEAAAVLEARSASPFLPDDLVFGYSSIPGKGGLRVLLALASRKQVKAYIEGHTPEHRKGGGNSAEIWARSVDARHAVIFPGYGETHRQRFAARWRWVAYGLFLSALGFAIAVAVTPTAQIRLRAIQAVNAHGALAHSANPLLDKREQVSRYKELLSVAEEIRANSLGGAQVMDLLTRILPDDTALQSLQVDGRKVSLAGQTENAAALMKRLSEEPGVSDVKAPAAAQKAPGTNKEVFRVEFSLDASATLGGKVSAKDSPLTQAAGASALTSASGAKP